MKQACLLFLALLPALNGADISSFGDWTRTFDATDLNNGAGTDFLPQFESAAGGTTINISNAPAGWRVLARRASGTWNNDLTVSVKRTSAGSGSGSISGGTTYIALSSTDSEIFAGSADRSGIAVQLKLTGLTREVAPNTYSSSVIFTVLPQ